MNEAQRLNAKLRYVDECLQHKDTAAADLLRFVAYDYEPACVSSRQRLTDLAIEYQFQHGELKAARRIANTIRNRKDTNNG